MRGARARPARCGAALALYGGVLLPEDRYEDWTLERREELERLREELEEGYDGEHADEPASQAAASRRARSSAASTSCGSCSRCSRDTRMLTLAGAGRLRQDPAGARARTALGGSGTRTASRSSSSRALGDGRQVAAAAAAALDIARPARPLASAGAGRLPRAARDAARARQLRARAAGAPRRWRDELLRAAPGLTDPRHQPRAAAGRGRGRLPGAVDGDPRSRARCAPEELLRYEAVRAVRRARGGAPCRGSRSTRRTRATSRESASAWTACRSRSSSRRRGSARSARATLADRLDDRFRLLQGGQPRGAVAPADAARRRSSGATSCWSEDERVLLRRLSVFAGGFDLAAVEAVCAGRRARTRGRRRRARAARREIARRGRAAGASCATGCSRPCACMPRERLRGRRRNAAALARAGAAGRSRSPSGTASARASTPRRPTCGSPTRPARAATRDALRYCIALLPFWMRRIDLEEAHRRFEAALAAAPERTELRADGTARGLGDRLPRRHARVRRGARAGEL